MGEVERVEPGQIRVHLKEDWPDVLFLEPGTFVLNEPWEVGNLAIRGWVELPPLWERLENVAARYNARPIDPLEPKQLIALLLEAASALRLGSKEERV